MLLFAIICYVFLVCNGTIKCGMVWHGIISSDTACFCYCCLRSFIAAIATVTVSPPPGLPPSPSAWQDLTADKEKQNAHDDNSQQEDNGRQPDNTCNVNLIVLSHELGM